MNHLKWMGHTDTVMEMQRSLRQDAQSCDILICAKDATVQAHRFVLCACSDYFRHILRDIPPDNETTIIIPDLKSNILEHIMTFIYQGEVCVNSSQLSDFFESINILGIKSPISFECHTGNKDQQKICQSAEVEDDYINNEEKDTQNDEEENSTTEACGAKDFEYLEVYNDEEKIDHYTIEQIEPESNNDEYVLSETSTNNTFQHLTATDVKQSSINNDDDSIKIHSDADEKVLMTLEPDEDHLNSVENDEKDEQNTDKSKVKDETYDLNEATGSRNEILDKAILAVIEDGMSLQKAAATFQISKTVIWRRVRKHPDYKMKGNPLITAAIEKLSQGETLKSVSAALDIPLSTLHRHKVKLYNEGRLPANIQIRKKDSKNDLRLRLNKAVKACQEGMSQNHAATVFAVPKSTLWRYIKRLKPGKKEAVTPAINVREDQDQQLVIEYEGSFSN